MPLSLCSYSVQCTRDVPVSCHHASPVGVSNHRNGLKVYVTPRVVCALTLTLTCVTSSRFVRQTLSLPSMTSPGRYVVVGSHRDSPFEDRDTSVCIISFSTKYDKPIGS
jgi:hypothetical protein